MSHNYWYLATPYSKYPGGIESAFKLAAREAGRLVRLGFNVYSPIAHTHPVAIESGLDPFDHKLWLDLDAIFMENAVGLVVLKATGWQESVGIKHEIEYFEKAGKTILYILPASEGN